MDVKCTKVPPQCPKYRGGRCSAIKKCKHQSTYTNADRILTDVDSLAVFGVAMYLQGCCDGNEEHLPDITVDSLRAYLMQPAPEEGEQNV